MKLSKWTYMLVSASFSKMLFPIKIQVVAGYLFDKSFIKE